jgi:hypothetical protein
MGCFWNRQELKDLNDFQDELTAIELGIIIKTRSVHAIKAKLVVLGLISESRICRYCLKSFKPNRRDQIYCCTNCCQLKARWRTKVRKERQ